MCSAGVIANRKIHHEGDGFDGGFASASDFEECSSHGKCHHEEVCMSIQPREKLYAMHDLHVICT